MKYQFLVKTVILTFLIATCFATINAQNSISEEFSWDNSEESKTLYLNVEKGAKKLQMNFDGQIYEGAFNLTAFDPEGNKVGGFSLVCSNGDGTHVHVDITDGDHTHSHVHRDDHSSHTNTIQGSNTNSHSSSTTTTTTVTTSDGKRRTKRKKKNKNKGKGEYSYSSSNSDSKGSKGVMKKTFSDPNPGKWKFVLEASEVSGSLRARVTQN